MTECFHCDTLIRPGREVTRNIDGSTQSMCCQGCATVAVVIYESGLQAYYSKRTARPRPVDESRQSLPAAFAEIFDDETVHLQFVTHAAETSSAHLIIQHMHCPTCVWLIESRLGALPGVQRVKVNFRTQQLKVSWHPDRLGLSDLIRCIQDLGYEALPYSPTAFSESIRAQHHDLLKRLGVAGIFGMQIMVVAVALYSSAWGSMDSTFEELFRRLSLLFVLPVLFYSAAPIFSGAWRDLKQRTATMDVPIALGLTIAFVASVAATLSGRGEVYYDSIAMFVFFQLIARFLEQGAYRRMTDRITTLSAAAPNHAHRLTEPDRLESAEIIPALRLKVGDYVLVNPGDSVPADGCIISGASGFDEAILTGESNVVQRAKGDAVFSGAVNVTQSVIIQTTRPSSQSALASIVSLLEDSVSAKPTAKRLTDLIAGRFSLAVVLLATGVGALWYLLGSSQWLSHTIAVLVIACPCALALAVPTALTAAVNAAARRNILLARPDAVHELAGATTFLFDKTGTLTENQAQLKHIEVDQQFDQREALQWAGTLARYSEHPICRALTRAHQEVDAQAAQVKTTHGGGVEGLINGQQYRLGSMDFIQIRVPNVAPDNDAVNGGLATHLARDHQFIASFHFDNPIRHDAKPVIADLKSLSMRLVMVTGDRQREAQRVASALAIDEVHWGRSPAEKLKIISTHQANGERVAMVGDGVNDAPTLAAANVSIAPAGAQQVAKANADILLLDDGLNLLSTARGLAEFTDKIMRANTVWAIAYNLIGISLAAAGFIPPLAAAIGMSASSMLVVGNSLRILSYR